MEDELFSSTKESSEPKIIKLQEDLKNNEVIITTPGDQLSELSNSSINCKISQNA